MSRTDAVAAYFAAMRAQDLEAFAALFSDNAEIVWPDGRAVSGIDAIRTTYARLFEHPSNNPQPGPVMMADDCCATEVHSKLPDGSERRTINVFHFGADDRFIRMASYRQG
ncbi:nuclear transport factor 2 family protein [Sphingomonas sp. SUN039]|uniref:YybH family protein n=1 Tax=Sphingomonas sp. SUN039 TaxID=2937787 RepID=UPI002164540A|nr:nuclear transport factor 2 family protein [Sphingomonas sp. SUN039]UVO52642.1 nuclear transport factor 2 family protein [Sphingomonas sp. SUN039]